MYGGPEVHWRVEKTRRYLEGLYDNEVLGANEVNYRIVDKIYVERSVRNEGRMYKTYIRGRGPI